MIPPGSPSDRSSEQQTRVGILLPLPQWRARSSFPVLRHATLRFRHASIGIIAGMDNSSTGTDIPKTAWHANSRVINNVGSAAGARRMPDCRSPSSRRFWSIGPFRASIAPEALPASRSRGKLLNWTFGRRIRHRKRINFLRVIYLPREDVRIIAGPRSDRYWIRHSLRRVLR